MRDRDIRSALRHRLEQTHKDEAETLLLDELGLCTGSARVDMAVVNGSLSGYEIKSEKDTLLRLPHQIEVYSKTLNLVTIVVGGTHLSNVLEMVPIWWGVEKVFSQDGEVVFETVREPEINQQVDTYALVQLLWRDEALALLKELKLDKGMSSKPRRAIWQKLAQARPADELGLMVRHQLKVRTGWRSAPLPKLHDD
jgi:hypothetical protein